MAAISQDFLWVQGDSGTLTINFTPPIPIGNRVIQFDFLKRAGGSGFFSKYWSGVDAVSGITVTDQAAGSLNIALNQIDTSGLPYGAYFYRARFTDSPPITFSEGFVLLEP